MERREAEPFNQVTDFPTTFFSRCVLRDRACLATLIAKLKMIQLTVTMAATGPANAQIKPWFVDSQQYSEEP